MNKRVDYRNRILGLEYIDAADLTAHPGNWRDHPQAQAEALKGVLSEVGIAGALLAYRSKRQGGALVVIDGHLRKDAAPQQWPVLMLDVDDAEADYLLATHDPLSAMATADAGALDALLSSVQSGEAAVTAMLAELAAGAGLYPAADDPQDAEPQIDRAEELRVKWGVETGQLWRLPSRTPGQEHRLICGDCTDASVVGRVMGGERTHLLMTSPPYWVGKEYEREQSWSEIQAFIERAAATFAAVTSHRIVINSGAPPAARLTGERAHIRLLIDDWQRELARHGLLMRYIRIWAKRGGLVHTAPISDCIDQHWEFIAVFYRPDTYEGQRRLGEKWATDGIWDDIQGEMSSHGHVAAFPIEIPERNIRLYTDEAHIVFDPFLGSGTTLIAAENLSRQCRAVELSPGYVAVALERYADAFGIEPELVD